MNKLNVIICSIFFLIGVTSVLIFQKIRNDNLLYELIDWQVSTIGTLVIIDKSLEKNGRTTGDQTRELVHKLLVHRIEILQKSSSASGDSEGLKILEESIEEATLRVELYETESQ